MLEKLFMYPTLAKYASVSKKWMDLFEFDIRNIDVSKEKISCTISFPEKLVGNDGIIHGGITCFVIDSISGIHAQLFSGKSGTALTKNLSVDFLAPIYPKNIYTVETSEIQGRIIVEYRQDNTVVARGNTEVVFK